MSDLKPRECTDHEYQCYKCGHASKTNFELVELLAKRMVENERGQQALVIQMEVIDDVQSLVQSAYDDGFRDERIGNALRAIARHKQKYPPPGASNE